MANLTEREHNERVTVTFLRFWYKRSIMMCICLSIFLFVLLSLTHNGYPQWLSIMVIDAKLNMIVIKPFPYPLSDLSWLWNELENDIVVDQYGEETGFWFNRDLIIRKIDDLYIIEKDDETIGFVLYNDATRIRMSMIWIRKEYRKEGLGRRVDQIHCQNLIENGHLAVSVRYHQEVAGFWTKCNYKLHANGKLYKNIGQTNIAKVEIFGINLPTTVKSGDEYAGVKVEQVWSSNIQWDLKNITAAQLSIVMAALSNDGACATRYLRWR